MPYAQSKIRRSYDYPGGAITRAAGGFSSDDTEVIGRWVQLRPDGSVLLLAANIRPYGVIATLSEDKVGVDVGPFVTGKQGPTAALTVNSPVTGDTRVVEAGGTAERGFIKNATVPAANLTAAYHLMGIVEQSEATTANTEGVASTVVRMY